MGAEGGRGPQVPRCPADSGAGGCEGSQAPALAQRSLLGLHWGQGSPHHGPLLPVIAANELACRGLDHLEEKIPALQYPPEKVSLFLFSDVPHTLLSLPLGRRGHERMMS